MEDLIEKVSRQDRECTDVDFPSIVVPEDEIVRLIAALKRNPYVRRIDFRDAECTPELFAQLDALFRVNSVIQHVRLPRFMSDAEFLQIESLRDLETLKLLDLSHCDVSGPEAGEMIQMILSQNRIREIYLRGNVDLGAEGGACIAQALRIDGCALKTLNLERCYIGNDGARDLSNALRNNNVLEVLNVKSNAIDFTGLQHVVETLETNSSLEVLILSDNPLNYGNAGQGTAGDLLSRALQNNTSLLELYVEFCGLPGTSISRVFQTLAGDNQTLSRLYIKHYRPDEVSLIDLEHYLPAMKGIREIDLTWNKGVSLPVVRGILRGLEVNRSLHAIRIRSDSFLQEAEVSVVALWHTWSQFFACRNKMRPLLEGGGREADLTSESAPHRFPPGTWPHLLQWCSRKQHDGGNQVGEVVKVSLMYHVLRATANDIVCRMVKMPAQG